MDNNAGGQGTQSKSVVDGIISAAKGVITNPVEFFRTMPKTGGFGDPLVFAVVLGVVMGVVTSAIGFVTFHGAMRWASLASIIWGPVAALIGSFIGAAIMFVIWKIMGSNENYETAYRCTAYSYAIAPIAALAGLIPYAGALVGLAWGLYLIVTASVEVHKIAAKTAWLVFGIITAIWAMVSIGSQFAARKISHDFQQNFGDLQRELNKANGGSGNDAAVDTSKIGTDAAKTAEAFQKMAEAQMKLARIQAEKAAKEAQAEADKAEKAQ